MSNGITSTTQGKSETAAEKEKFDSLVAQFSALFGIDEETIVDFYTVVNAPVDPETGLNKYNLTKANVDVLRKYFDPEDYNYAAAQELLNSISNTSTTDKITSNELNQVVSLVQLGHDVNSIADILGFGSAQDRARNAKAGRMVPDYDEAGNLIPDGKGGYKMKPFAGHFSEDYHYIINSLSGEQDIIDFQNYLIENKVVDPAFFLGSEGQYSSQLTGVSAEVEANWRSKQENLKLFNYAVQEFSKLKETEALQQRNILTSEVINNLKKTYRVASPIQRKELVDDWFFQKLGRKGTKEEITEWANEIAESPHKHHL